jgi:selenide,water dikinase
MTALNKTAAELMTETPAVHACTDITGFGLLGHAAEIIEGSDTGMAIHASAVPFFPGIREFVEMGVIPAGLHRNRAFRNPMIDIGPDCPDWMVDILFDPQTSGGLLIAVSGNEAGGLVERMRDHGVSEATVIGEIVAKPRGIIRLV